MDGISWQTLIMLNQSIPDIDTDTDKEPEIDSDNWQKYVNQ